MSFVTISAQLFTGTGLECSNGSCVIGCANIDRACSNYSGYGVNYVTYTSNTAKQSQLISHEMGHVLGAPHDSSSQDNIMYPSNVGDSQRFSSTTIGYFIDPSRNECVTTGTPPPPYTPPPPPELQSGVAETNLSGAQGEWLNWVMPMPANVESVECSITGGSGDAGECQTIFLPAIASSPLTIYLHRVQ